MRRPGSALSCFLVVLAVLGASASSSQLIRSDAQANSVCKSFKLCHNSKGLAWTSMSVFQALEPLFDELKLSPMNDYVEISELPNAPGAVKAGCSCSTPVVVQLSLPIAPGGATDVLLGLVDRFVQERLVPMLKDVVCVSPLATVACQAPAEPEVVQRRRLSEEVAPVEAAAVDETSPFTNPDDLYMAEVAPSPVPDMEAMMMESAAAPPTQAGGYYAAPEAGGYYAPAPEAGGYYSPAPEAGQYAPAPEAGYYGSAGSSARPTSRMLNSEAGEPSHVSASKRSHPASTCPPCPACGEASYLRAAKLAATAGTCYCRYDAATATWALDDASCRSALYARCGAAGSLLECSKLEAFYSVESPAAASAIASFLFVDCPPAAPCSCSSMMFDGRAPATPQCCSDLRAHCQVPFGGLSCRAVDAVCAGMASSDVKAFVKVKTHHAVCAAAPQAAYRLAHAEADVQEGAAEAADMPSTLGAALLGLMFGAGFLAVSMAGVGVMALVQHFVRRQGAAAPLLGDY